MADLIRDSPFGQLVRLVTRNRVFQYPEERPDFILPAVYSGSSEKHHHASTHSPPVYPDPETVIESKDRQDESSSDGSELEQIKSHHSATSVRSQEVQAGINVALERSHTQADLEKQTSLSSIERGPSRPIEPERLNDGTILVDWYTTDDPENPQNWSGGKKASSAVLIYLYTLAVYMGSAIYSPSIPGVVQHFGVSIDKASMGLSMYVLAYGIGPMIFSPLSEIPIVGRNLPYITTYAIFVILCVPTALVDNFDGLIALRFLQGFFGSPCLATGGASLQDMYAMMELPYVMSLWAFAATCGPALGPIISGFSVEAMDWRWSLWEMLWLNGPILILLFFFLPETGSSNILLRRAQRLRKLTGNTSLKAQAEIDQAHLTPRGIAIEALWRPIELMLLDPSIAFTAIYTALIYGIYYSFFEAFPLVYTGMYHFTMGKMGLTFLSITVGVTIAICWYWWYLRYVVTPIVMTKGLGTPETRLIPALVVCWLIPIGLFIFGWTANEDIHWIASVIGIAVTTIGIFLLLQCILLYLPMS